MSNATQPKQKRRTSLRLFLSSPPGPSLFSFYARIPSKRDGLTYKKAATIKYDGSFHLRLRFPGALHAISVYT